LASIIGLVAGVVSHLGLQVDLGKIVDLLRNPANIGLAGDRHADR